MKNKSANQAIVSATEEKSDKEKAEEYIPVDFDAYSIVDKET